MSENIVLTLEQQFALMSFSAEIKTLTREEAKRRLIKLYEQMLIQDIYYKSLIAKAWGIELSDEF